MLRYQLSQQIVMSATPSLKCGGNMCGDTCKHLQDIHPEAILQLFLGYFHLDSDSIVCQLYTRTSPKVRIANMTALFRSEQLRSSRLRKCSYHGNLFPAKRSKGHWVRSKYVTSFFIMGWMNADSHGSGPKKAPAAIEGDAPTLGSVDFMVSDW